MFCRSYLGAQGQNDRRHDHYTVSTCNFIVGVDGDARVLVIFDAQQPNGTSFVTNLNFVEKILRLYAAVLNRFEADLRSASIRTGVQMVCEEKFDQQWLEVPTEHSYGVAWDVSLIHQYPATKIGNMRFESNEFTIKNRRYGWFLICFRSLCMTFASFVQVEKLLGELGLGNVSKLRLGLEATRLTRLTRSTSYSCRPSKVTAFKRSRSKPWILTASMSWDGRPSRRPNEDGEFAKKRVYWEMGGSCSWYFSMHALQDSSSLLNWKYFGNPVLL